MLSEQQKIALIEKHFSDDLTETEKVLFEDLQSDEDFEEALNYHNDFVTSIEVFGNEQMKVHFQNLEASIQAEEEKSTVPSGGLLSEIKEHIDYSLDQLIALFQPVANYSMAMSYTSRAKGLSINKPLNELDCTHGLLDFELSSPTSKALTVQIENNQQSLILREQIPANEAFFMVDLPSDLTPGIYYWKLSNEDDLLIGSFFIRKDLMPAG